MIVGTVIDHQIGNQSHPARMDFMNQAFEILNRSKRSVDALIVRDIVTVVAERTWIRRLESDTIDAQLVDIIEPGD